MKNNVNIDGISFSPRTAELILENSITPIADVAILKAGMCSKASLLALCLTGGPEESENWHEYVSAVAIAAGVS